MTKPFRSLTVAFLAVLAFGLLPQSACAKDVIKIGALLSLTGDWSTLGLASQASLEIATDRINDQWEAEGSKMRVTLLVEDTQLNPDLAVTKFKALIQKGVRVVIGPQSSAEIAAIKPLADANGILVISQGSTASSLAIEGDAIFRLVPTDIHEGEAVAALMHSDGIEKVVPIWRNDAGNGGLKISTLAAFQTLGGTGLAGVTYNGTEADFADEVTALAAQVTAAKDGGSAVAVYIASFDEGITILAQADNFPVLKSVRWYSGDGLTLSTALLANATAAGVASTVQFTAPSLGLDPDASKLQNDLTALIQAKVGFAPDAFALAAYDAGWLGALAYRAASDSPWPAALANRAAQEKKFRQLKAAFTNAANRYWGAIAQTTLDSAGDLDHGNYDFWTVNAGTWTHTSSYVNDKLIFP